jgi:alpha-beta hydrolase superfamily lysophospholipase
VGEIYSRKMSSVRDCSMKNLDSIDGKTLYYQVWEPEVKTKAVVQIVHGMAEHSGSYAEIAVFLSQHGYKVYCHDQRGHGKTAGSRRDYGYIADEMGWQLLLEDIHIISSMIRSEQQLMPLFIYGHSMGSLLTQHYIRHWGEEIDGVLLSGTPVQSALLLAIGRKIAEREIHQNGGRSRSQRLCDLTFGNYNRKFKQTKTPYDWLSRDKEKVAAYIADEYCGGTFTAGFFLDLISGMQLLRGKDNLHKIPHNLAFLFITGERDAANANAKGIWKLIDEYERCGFFDLEAIFYPEFRHDLKLELNREMVFNDMVTWLNEKVREFNKS